MLQPSPRLSRAPPHPQGLRRQSLPLQQPTPQACLVRPLWSCLLSPWMSWSRQSALSASSEERADTSMHATGAEGLMGAGLEQAGQDLCCGWDFVEASSLWSSWAVDEVHMKVRRVAPV